MTDSPPIAEDYGFERVPPHSIEAETCVIGSLLLSASDAMPVTQIVTPDDFYRPAHHHIYATIVEMLERGEPIDLVTIKEALLRLDILADVGGIDYVVAIVEGTPSVANAEYYAKIVRDKSILRSAVTACTESVDACFATTAEAEVVLATLTARIYALDQRLHGALDDGDGLIGDAVKANLARFKTIAAGEADPLPPVSTGFAELDAHMLGGPRPGEVLVVAAGPEVGKSMLCLMMAGNVCTRGGGVVYVSAEMKTREIAHRIVSARTGIHNARMLKGDVTEADIEIIGKAYRTMKRKWKMRVVDRALTVQQIGVEARRWAMKWRGLDLIVVDYLQRMKLGRGDTKSERVGDFSCGIKNLALELDVPVVLICQINREGKKAERPPILSDLRDSGSIEDDADYVLMMFQALTQSFRNNSARGYGRVNVSFRKGRNAGHTDWGHEGIHLAVYPHIMCMKDDPLEDRIAAGKVV